MDTGLTIRSTLSAAVAPARLDVAPVREAVQTELPASSAVAAISESEGVVVTTQDRSGPLQAQIGAAIAQQLKRETERRVIYDDATKEPVYSTVDSDSGRVLHQFPDEALLRLRAYARAERDVDLDLGEPGSVEERVERVA